MTTVNSDTPLLVRELIKKAGSLGITEEALCHRLSISHSHFSRWRTGLRSAPDPRNSENRVFYKNAADLLGKSLGEVLSYVIFPDSSENQDLTNWVFDSIIDKKKSIPIPALSSASQKLILSLVVNVPGREEFLKVLNASFQAYVRDVLGEEWYEDANSAIQHYRALNQRQPLSYELTLTQPDSEKKREVLF